MAIDLSHTPLEDVIRDVFDNSTATTYKYELVLFNGENEVEYVKLMHRHEVHDYVLDNMPIIMVQFMMLLGIYSRQVMPYRENFQVIERRYEIKSSTGQIDETKPTVVRTYTAILNDRGQNPTQGQGLEAVDEESMNLRQFIEVDFQLFELGADRLRAVEVCGNWRQLTPKELMMALLQSVCMSCDVNTNDKIKGLDIAEGDTSKRVSVISIESGISAVEVPRWLQKKIGVYPFGLGSYLYKKIWYVYPLTNTQRYKTTSKILTIVVIPKAKYPHVERTYNIDGDVVTILANDDTGKKDGSGLQTVLYGGGITFHDASPILNGVAGGHGGARVIRGTNRFITDPRTNGANIVRHSSERITANADRQLSKMTSRVGSVFKMIWQNSQPELLYPGMPAQVYYFDQARVCKFDAVLLYADHLTITSTGLVGDHYQTQSQLQFYATEPPIDDGT